MWLVVIGCMNDQPGADLSVARYISSLPKGFIFKAFIKPATSFFVLAAYPSFFKGLSSSASNTKTSCNKATFFIGSATAVHSLAHFS